MLSYFKGFIGAVFGVMVVLTIVHLYQDHQALHQIIGFVNANASKIVGKP